MTPPVPANSDMRPGELAVPLPDRTDAGVYFIGVIHTPWTRRADCPKRGDLDAGPECSIVRGLSRYPRIQLLYWMHHARRDLVLQTPNRTGETIGTFALRSPVRPNPIASSVVALLGIEGMTVRVRGLDCLDGTPLVDIKPDRNSGEE
jgi:tRNA-Thr(GGU) m(6)t(6)A37 methyltransferase TsaA